MHEARYSLVATVASKMEINLFKSSYIYSFAWDVQNELLTRQPHVTGVFNMESQAN
jgi:hypothetical protein